MKYLTIASGLLLAFGLLCGCGGGGITSSPAVASRDFAGNWQFGTSSAAQGETLGIGGSINQSGSAVNGAVHVSSQLEKCFDYLTTVGLTGTVTDGNNVSLTSTPVGGVVIAFTGRFTDTTLTGTYTLQGGCNDQGNVTGVKIPPIAGKFCSTFTPLGEATFDALIDVTQGNANSDGSFGLTGTVTSDEACFTPGTIRSGTLSSGSFIIGNSVAFEMEGDNGTVTILGTVDPVANQISGGYTVSGGTCDQQTGTVFLSTQAFCF